MNFIFYEMLFVFVLGVDVIVYWFVYLYCVVEMVEVLE